LFFTKYYFLNENESIKNSMNKFDRIIAILILLQSRRTITASDIADKFNISVRTVYRDINSLCEAGVPVAATAGRGYSMMEGYNIPPIMFNKEELTAILTAEKLIEKFTDKSILKNFNSATAKIRSILKYQDKELLEDFENNIAVIRNRNFNENFNDSSILQKIINSISSKKALEIEYFSFYSSETNIRIIEPIGIFLFENNWHTIAFCKMRNSYRNFRLDRIRKITPTEFDFQKIHPSINEYIAKMSFEKQITSIVINIDKKYAKYLNERKYFHGFVDEIEFDEHIQMTFINDYHNSFLRWFISFADVASIVQPEELKLKLVNLFSEIKKNIFIEKTTDI
jgi:predicted DNA-binding transcriptional regulator YafY